MQQEGRVNTTQSYNEVCFPNLDGFLCNVALVVVGWNQLVLHLISDSDCSLQFLGYLIVKEVKLVNDVACREAIHQHC